MCGDSSVVPLPGHATADAPYAVTAWYAVQNFWYKMYAIDGGQVTSKHALVTTKRRL